MPFNLVSAWNKRRRSKSHDHTDPCMFFLLPLLLLFLCNFVLQGGAHQLFHTFQGFINRWSIGNLMIKPHNPQKDTIMVHQFSHSKKWKRQHVHSVKRICSEKEDLVAYTEELCSQGRYISFYNYL